MPVHRRFEYPPRNKPDTSFFQIGGIDYEESIMKKLSKRFLTLAIACVMAMMMAVPAFAIGNPTVSSGRYKIYPNGKTTSYYKVVVIRVPLQGQNATIDKVLWIGLNLLPQDGFGKAPTTALCF
jgi:hypothetical protein